MKIVNSLPENIIQAIKKKAEELYPFVVKKNKNGEYITQRVGQNPYGWGKHQKIIKAYIAGATEYATKLHQAEQEIKQLKRWKAEASALLNPILEYGQSKEAGIPLGDSIPAVVIERCKRYDAASILLERIAHRHEGGLLPDRFLYNEIKTFLDGK